MSKKKKCMSRTKKTYVYKNKKFICGFHFFFFSIQHNYAEDLPSVFLIFLL